MKTPRELFRKNEADAKALAILVNEEWFLRAVVYALSDMAQSDTTIERINGARQFFSHLQSLAEDEKPTEAMPDKSSLPSYA